MTYKPNKDKKGPSSEIKEAINLKLVSKAIITPDDTLEITNNQGDLYQYKGANLDVWLEVITVRWDWSIGKVSKSKTSKYKYENLTYIYCNIFLLIYHY